MNAIVLACALLFAVPAAPAQVVINEVLYRAPADLDVEYVELHNPGAAAVDLEGWKLGAGIDYTFRAGATIEAGGYLVLARRADLFRQLYSGIEPFDEFKGSLSDGGEALVLTNPEGEVVETVSYGDSAPWPLSADGYSASLERISPSAPAGKAANWAPSALSEADRSRPAGTPGAKNGGYSRSLPPVVKSIDVGPTVRRADEAIAIEARVEGDAADLGSVELLYRVIEPGKEGDETSIPMVSGPGGLYSATVPGQPANRLIRIRVRVRVRATDASGAVRIAPHPNDLRPAESIWVREAEIAVGQIPVLQFFNVGAEEHRRAQEAVEDQRRGRGRGGFPGGFPGGGRPRFNEDDRERAAAENRERPGEPGPEGRGVAGREERPGPEPGRRPEEGDAGGRDFGGRGPGRDRGPGRRGFGGPGFGPFGSRPSAPLPAQGRSALLYTDPQTKETQLFDFVWITPRKSGHKVRFPKDRALHGATTLNILYEPDERSILTEALAYELYGLAGSPTLRASYVRVILDGQTVGYHLAFEQPNGAYLRRIGRQGGNLYKVIWQGSNRPSQYTPASLLPKRQDIAARHEKKTHPHEGYNDLIELVESLEQTKDPAALWELIEERFVVDEVIDYFAVNTLLSHWDGFFNNYYLYHDIKGTGKWTMLPWDQDSTWGHRMGRGDEVFAAMPLTFGMEGDEPPGASPGGEGGDRRGGFGRGFGGFGGFGRGAMWWRPGGEISRPLLANPEFRRRFLARLEELAKTVYTEEVFGPKLDALRAQLGDEVRLRAKTSERSEDDAVRALDDSLSFFREHLVKRRAYILEHLDEQRRAIEER